MKIINGETFDTLQGPSKHLLNQRTDVSHKEQNKEPDPKSPLINTSIF